MNNGAFLEPYSVAYNLAYFHVKVRGNILSNDRLFYAKIGHLN